MTQGSPPHMKIAGLFSREYPGVFPEGTIGENWVPEGSLRVDILQPSCGVDSGYPQPLHPQLHLASSLTALTSL
jgi:hypothetical protein